MVVAAVAEVVLVEMLLPLALFHIKQAAVAVYTAVAAVLA
jgi:hypothetical protein